MKWALGLSWTEGNWASLTSQHRGLLSSGHSQTFRWPSLSPRRQLLLLHSTEGGWGDERVHRSLRLHPLTRLPKPRLP